MSNKRLYKSTVNCMLCGVCGGIAEYFDIDPTLVRLAWVILTCFGGASTGPTSSQPLLFQKHKNCIIFCILFILLIYMQTYKKEQLTYEQRQRSRSLQTR